MHIVYVSAEVFPYSKTGGLADIAHFLPKGITDLGHKVTVITPYYQLISKYHDQMSFIGRKTIVLGGIETIVNYFLFKQDKVDIIFIQNMHYFERDKFYGYNDDAERFTCFSYATLNILEDLDVFPDILHINDWQTGMIPYLLDTHYRYKDKYKNLPTVLTIHNLEYQGVFDTYVARFFNSEFSYDYIHFDKVNFLKAGILKATKINTVSPNYKNEILTRAFGFTLDGQLNNRHNDLSGILNGIDASVFNPKTDPFIKNYDHVNHLEGKLANKRELFSQFNLKFDINKPLISYIGRYANQKGIWMISEILEILINQTNANFFFLGSGDAHYENFFKYISEKYPDRVGNFIGYNEKLAHLVYASSNVFMMPSEFEPCGLGQMIAMKYGALPVVRETGGLKNTVTPFNKFTKNGTGFSFANLMSYELKDKIFEAVNLFNHDKKTFDQIVLQAMHTDFTNEVMSIKYIALYKTILGG